MPIVTVIVWMGTIILGPLVVAVAIREVYRRVVLTDRGLAAAAAAIFSAYCIATMILGPVLVGLPIATLFLWASIGFVGIFVVVFPLTMMGMPTLKYLLRNVPRAEQGERS